MKRNEPKKNQSKTMLPPAFQTLLSLFCWAYTLELDYFFPEMEALKILEV